MTFEGLSGTCRPENIRFVHTFLNIKLGNVSVSKWNLFVAETLRVDLLLMRLRPSAGSGWSFSSWTVMSRTTIRTSLSWDETTSLTLDPFHVFRFHFGLTETLKNRLCSNFYQHLPCIYLCLCGFYRVRFLTLSCRHSELLLFIKTVSSQAFSDQGPLDSR